MDLFYQYQIQEIELSKEIDSDLTYLRPSQPIEYAINIDVVDDGGDALSDVMVTFTNLDTEKSFNITTDSTGNCKISDLPKGKYSYKIEKKGYNSNDGTKKVHEDSYLKIKLNIIQINNGCIHIESLLNLKLRIAVFES